MLLPQVPPEFANDAPFGESYDLIREVGRGGMAIVYLVRERATGEERAVKVIHTKYLGDEDARARFEREARLVAQLKHPNIVATHSLRWIEAVGLGLVMDHVRGRTLKQILRDGAPISFERATRILDDIAAALSYAHARNIVHRDVKPENIFIDEVTGRALLADFGIARTAQGETQLTVAGVAIGTPTYMAPEQIDGSAIDARSDLYSLGLVGWEMLTGRRPWDGETLYNVIYHQKHDYLAAIDELRSDAPARLVFAIEGLLEKSPRDRWQTADDFRAELVSTEAPVRRKRKSPAFVPVASAARPDETVAIVIPPELRVRSRLRRIAPTAVAAALLVSATLLFARPMPSWLPLRITRPVTHTAAANHRRPPASAIHSPASGYGAGNGAGGITSDAGAAGSALVGSSAPAAAGDSAVQQGAQGAQGAQRISIGGDTALAKRTAISQRTSTPVAIASVPQATPPAPASAPPTDTPRTAAAADHPPAAPATSTENVVPRSAARFAIATGGAHTCLVAAAGATYCWGANSSGQLGIGTTETRSTPTAVAGSVRFASVAPGLSHTCAITARGATFCWGNNEHGQLGEGTRTPRAAPTPVAFEQPLASIVSGAGFSCGLTSEGQVYCWGAGARGQIGNGTTAERTTPTRTPAPTTFTSLAAGWNHVCGLSETGEAYCWGANDSGELGDGTTTDRSVPTPVHTTVRFTALSAGSAHTCGVTAGHAVYCWGDNKYGQLGDGTRLAHTTPAAIAGGERFVSVSAGSVHTCALTPSHDAWCWGRNTYGQLGDGSATSRPSPVRVSGNHDFTSVNAFGAHTCGTTASNELFCWGYNLDGQLGDGTREHRLRPTYIEKPTG